MKKSSIVCWLIFCSLMAITVLLFSPYHTPRRYGTHMHVEPPTDTIVRGVLGREMDNISSVVIFGVASVHHQVMELTRTLQAQRYLVKRVGTVHELSVDDPFALYILLTPQLVPVLPDKFVAYQTEQWGSSWISSPWGSLHGETRTRNYSEVFTAAIEVWDYNRWNIANFEYPAGLRREQVRYVPFAWFPSTALVLNPIRDIDVLFFGAMNDKRERKLSQLAELGVNITTVTAQGTDLDVFVLRSKIVLNLHYYDGLLETSRIMQAISLKALVVSEMPKDTDSIRDFSTSIVLGDDIVSLAQSIFQYLRDEGQRRGRVEKAYDVCRTKFALPFWLSQTCVSELAQNQH